MSFFASVLIFLSLLLFLFCYLFVGTYGISATLYASLHLDEEDEDGLVVAPTALVAPTVVHQRKVVSKFLTRKPIRFQIMRQTLASVWQLIRKVFIEQLEPNLFTFQFYHEIDVNNMLGGGPGTFKKSVLAPKLLEGSEDSHMVVLNNLPIWVQVLQLPTGFMFKVIAKDIDNKLGGFIASDPKNFSEVWRPYMCIRVNLDVTKLIRRRMSIGK